MISIFRQRRKQNTNGANHADQRPQQHHRPHNFVAKDE
ncbi:Uncharacterised protein [Yersinia enterocolitica]|nr:Uncharacterised protein [Yersinia enterocolitica]